MDDRLILTVLFFFVLFLLLGRSDASDLKKFIFVGKSPMTQSETEPGTKLRLMTDNIASNSGDRNFYSTGVDCKLTVTYPNSKTGSAKLTFSTFEVDCQSDRLTINGIHYCGKQTSREICVTGNNLKVQFLSDDVNSSHFRGFDITAEISNENECPCKTEWFNATICLYPTLVQGDRYCATKNDHPSGASFCSLTNQDSSSEITCDGHSELCGSKKCDMWICKNWLYVFLVLLFCFLILFVISARTICYTPPKPDPGPIYPQNQSSVNTSFASIQRHEQPPDGSGHCSPCEPEPMIYDELYKDRMSSIYFEPGASSSYINPSFIESEPENGGSQNDPENTYINYAEVNAVSQ